MVFSCEETKGTFSKRGQQEVLEEMTEYLGVQEILAARCRRAPESFVEVAFTYLCAHKERIPEFFDLSSDQILVQDKSFKVTSL